MLIEPKLLPIWGGEEYELYAGEVHHWNKVSTDSEYSKYHDLREVLKKKKGLEKVMDTIVSRTEADNNKTVKRIMELLEEKFGKTYAEKVMDVMGEMDRLKNGGEGETEEQRWEMFRKVLSEFKRLKLREHTDYMMAVMVIKGMFEGDRIMEGEKRKFLGVMEDEKR